MNAETRSPESATTRDTRADAVIARMEATIARVEDMLALEADYEPAARSYELPPHFLLSVVIPVYNEQATIARVVARVASLPIPKEILIVNDCSRDGTGAVLDRLASQPGVRVFHQDRNQGKGAALRVGFQAARGSLVVVQDADLEYDPRDILELLPPVLNGEADAVFGSRFLHETPQDKSFIHRLGNWGLTTLSNLFTGLRVTDMETCYKVFRREQLQAITLRQDRFGFEPEITAKLARRGAKIVERPIRYHARSYAEGKKIGVKDLFNALWCIVRYGLAD